MATLKRDVKDSDIERIKAAFNIASNDEVIAKALGLLHYAARQKELGREIYCSDPDMKEVVRILI